MKLSCHYGVKIRVITHLSDDVVQKFHKILLLNKSRLKVVFFFGTDALIVKLVDRKWEREKGIDTI